MDNKGWISLHRSIQDHWLWETKPFDKRSAWVDILLTVNHKDNKIMLDGKLVIVPRGSMITSIRKLCDRWDWSNTKVKRFLDVLQVDGMITHKSDTKKTVINVVNYSDYQKLDDTKNVAETSQKHHRNDTETSQKHTNNNVNNVNNIIRDNSPEDESHKNGKRQQKEYAHDSFEMNVVNYLIDKILEMLPNAKVPEKDQDKYKWCDHVEKMKRLDSKTEEQIRKVLKFCTTDSFWRTTILSTAKMRKQFDTLYIQATKGTQGKKKTKEDTTPSYDYF